MRSSASSSAVSPEFEIATTTVVRAVEIASDGTRSPVVTATYLFPEQVLSSPVLDPGITGHPTYGPIVATTLRDLPVDEIGWYPK